MLIQKVTCPYGCNNSTMNESTRVVDLQVDNLLLDNAAKPNGQSQKTVKVYTCSCCNKSFEVPAENKSNVLHG